MLMEMHLLCRKISWNIAIMENSEVSLNCFTALYTDSWVRETYLKLRLTGKITLKLQNSSIM